MFEKRDLDRENEILKKSIENLQQQDVLMKKEYGRMQEKLAEAKRELTTYRDEREAMQDEIQDLKIELEQHRAAAAPVGTKTNPFAPGIKMKRNSPPSQRKKMKRQHREVEEEMWDGAETQHREVEEEMWDVEDSYEEYHDYF